MHDHGWLLTCAVLLVFPATAIAQSASSGIDSSEATEDRLRELEAKYEETGEPKYLFERALMLEEMGEYQFALQIIEKHREEFQEAPEVEGVAVVEQRLQSEVPGTEPDSGSDASSDTGLFDWTLVGTGAGSFAAGLTTVLVAEHRAKRLRCSPGAEGVDANGCSGVQPYEELTRSEFDDKKRGVRTLRIVGIGIGAVGTGLASWGLVRLLNGGSRPNSTGGPQAIHPTAVWTPDGGRVGVVLEF